MSITDRSEYSREAKDSFLVSMNTMMMLPIKREDDLPRSNDYSLVIKIRNPPTRVFLLFFCNVDLVSVPNKKLEKVVSVSDSGPKRLTRESDCTALHQHKSLQEQQ